MKLKQKISIIILIISAIYTIYINIQNVYIQDALLKIHYIDVGQGDSTLIITPSKKSILIDAGDEKSSNRTINYIKKQAVDKLDLVIATHPDADHIGGMDKIIQNFEIDMFCMPLVSKDTLQYKQIIKELKNKKIKNTPLYTKDKLNIDKDIEFEILSPNKDFTSQDSNEYSIVARLVYKNNSFLFMADASMENEIMIINQYDNIQTDVLKLGHHGSSTSSSEYFLKKVNPKIAVISCGKNNKYGHPHREILRLLEKYDIKTFRTDIDKDIVLKSDGNKIMK